MVFCGCVIRVDRGRGRIEREYRGRGLSEEGRRDKREIWSKPWREGLCGGGVEVGKLYVTRIVIRP
jgi:hypothetical protein